MNSFTVVNILSTAKMLLEVNGIRHAPSSGFSGNDSVAEWEKFRISQALKQSDGNKAEVARRLGVHRRLLYEKIRKLGLDAGDQPLENESLNSGGDV